MVAPIAQKVLAPVVGADAALIWFGVMLCVNMQTSFLHPPFGFALFYLRGVAPKEVKSSDIYWGALPWIGLQAIMVAIVIAFPVTVTALLDKPADRRSQQGQDRGTGNRASAAGFRYPKAIASAGRGWPAPPEGTSPPLRANSLAVSTNFQLTTTALTGLVQRLHAGRLDKPLRPRGAVKTADANWEGYRCKRS